MSKNPLSDIYANKVLLNEEKDNVVVPSGKQEIAKDGKVHLVKDGGDDKVKKHLKTPEKTETPSGVFAKKEVKENMNTETTTKNAFEGAFERLFKSTLNEDVAEDTAADVEIPTTDMEMADEINDEKDEVSDLASDIKAVITHLESILDKLSSGEVEETEDEEVEEEFGSEEEPFEESVEAEDHGHALVNAKSGKDLVGPKGKLEVKGAVKVTKGKAVDGKLVNEPVAKELHANHSDLQNTKKQAVKTSNIKVGDFFK
jgi:hypothetical protein